MRNVPDDWDCYWSKCERCKSKVHASEGGCGCTEDLIKCGGGTDCGEAEDGWIDPADDDVTEVDDHHYCEHHTECQCCGVVEDLAEGENELLCITCIDSEHEACSTCTDEQK